MAKRRRDRFQSPHELAVVLRVLIEDARSPARDTLLESGTCTLTDIPIVIAESGEMARTEVLNHADIGFVIMPEEEVPRRPRTILSLNPARFVIALLIAALALVLIWLTDIGPGTLNG